MASSLETAFFDRCPGSTPFPDAESAWFWCVQTSEALHGGARLRAGHSRTIRPCEPVDIQTVVLRLARQALLSQQHLSTLAEFGQQQLRPKSHPHALLWAQAMERLTPALTRKGIIHRKGDA